MYLSHYLCKTASNIANSSIILNKSLYSFMYSWPLTIGKVTAPTSWAFANCHVTIVGLSICRSQQQSWPPWAMWVWTAWVNWKKYPSVSGCTQLKLKLFKGQLYLLRACIWYLHVACVKKDFRDRRPWIWTPWWWISSWGMDVSGRWRQARAWMEHDLESRPQFWQTDQSSDRYLWNRYGR